MKDFTVDAKAIVEIGLVVLMILFVILLFRYRQGNGIGERIIQFTCITFLIPAILILGLEKIMQGDTIGTLLGAIGGYILSSMSKGKDTANTGQKNTPTP